MSEKLVMVSCVDTATIDQGEIIGTSMGVPRDITFDISERDSQRVQELTEQMEHALMSAPVAHLIVVGGMLVVKEDMERCRSDAQALSELVGQNELDEDSPISFGKYRDEERAVPDGYRGEEIEVSDGYRDEEHAVLVEAEEAHLFPWLVKESLYRIGIREPDLSVRADQLARHEFSHVEPVQNITNCLMEPVNRSKKSASFRRDQTCRKMGR